jgi:O-antigen/teichoic acid export membrane protein
MSGIAATPAGSGYARDAVLAAAARIAPLGVQLIATPFVIASAGIGSYAVWALLTTTINLLLTADLGVVGIMQRYHGIARGREDWAMGGRITATVLAVLFLLLVVVTALGPWIADAALAVVQVAPDVRDAAWNVFRHAGTLSVLQLIGLALASYLAAHSRFVGVAVASLGARLVFVAALVVVLTGSGGLDGLVVAAYVDASAGILLGLVLCRRHLVKEVRHLARRDELAELWSYAWRNQASAIGFVAQRESDVIMAAIMLPAALQATIASSAQLAAAVALAPTVLLVPLFTRLSIQAGRSRASAVKEAGVAEGNWFSLAIPFAAVVLAVTPFFAAAWLGPALPHVAGVTALLLLGFLVVLANPVKATLVRAIGAPGLETLSYGALLLVKLGVGIPATLLLGIYGLAGSTVLASLVAVACLWWLARRSVPGLVAGRVQRRSVITGLAVLTVGAPASALISATVGDRWLQVAALAGLGMFLAVTALLIGRPRRSAD